MALELLRFHALLECIYVLTLIERHALHHTAIFPGTNSVGPIAIDGHGNGLSGEVVLTSPNMSH